MEDLNILQQPVSLFKTSYPLALRLWHWITFVMITASITMVLLASTIFTMKDNSAMVQQQIQEKGGTVSHDQARAVAHEYNDKLWNLHKYIGYGLCFLLLGRVLMEASFSRERKLSNKIKNAIALKTNTESQQNDRRHYIWVKWGYVFFYFLLTVMALTGLGLAFEDVPFLKNIHNPLVTIHGFTQFLIYAYIVFHLIGVIRADLTDNKGIVSGMINGNQGN